MQSKTKTAGHSEAITKWDFAGGEDAVDCVTPCAMRYPSECNEPIIEVALRALGTHHAWNARSTFPQRQRHHWPQGAAQNNMREC
jgi:hypothetical protein